MLLQYTLVFIVVQIKGISKVSIQPLFWRFEQ